MDGEDEEDYEQEFKVSANLDDPKNAAFLGFARICLYDGDPEYIEECK